MRNLKNDAANRFYSKGKLLVGMVHLTPLFTFDGYPGLKVCLDRAAHDLACLQEAGFDAVLIENDDDKPSMEKATPAQIANFAIVAHELSKLARVPLGVQLMLNDWESSVAIAKLVGASFTRIDVFVDDVAADNWGLEIHPNPTEIMAYVAMHHPELIVLTDIQVKYKRMLEAKPLEMSAQQAIASGSSGLIVTGAATGQETPIEKIKLIRSTFPDFPLWVGAGIDEHNVVEQLSYADGLIVGSSVKGDDKLIDPVKARRLVEKAHS